MTKRTPTLNELIENEIGKAHPNPFVQACVEQLTKMKEVVDAVPPSHLLDAHSECAAALLILCAEPTQPNLQAARDAMEAYAAAEFCN